jgi:hypothetical protein
MVSQTKTCLAMKKGSQGGLAALGEMKGSMSIHLFIDNHMIWKNCEDIMKVTA